jgi:hypothetical protein
MYLRPSKSPMPSALAIAQHPKFGVDVLFVLDASDVKVTQASAPTTKRGTSADDRRWNYSGLLT